ncbi:MAG: HAD family phosphatase [Clostridia bacterium]|nr:HAD family phosphatase [Clostridia bacterium]
MDEGIRFDLAYKTMPWDQVDAVIFDIGNVLIRFSPEEFLPVLFPGDEGKQSEMLERVYRGKYWLEFDRGVMTYEEAAQLLSVEYGGTYEEYMHALTGWFDCVYALEEGWKTVQRCRQEGKKVYLLSNYPRQGYENMRERFASYFDSQFDGGVISCYVHQLKPEKEIYQTLIDQCGKDPSRMVFIDDTLMNVEGAMKMGIHGFHMHEKGMMDRFFV